MPPPPSSPAVLTNHLNTPTTLLSAFQAALSSPPPPPTIPNPPNALSLLHDASSLLQAQTTKLSLLLLNKPFTPSAIASIFTSLSSSCLPGLTSVWELSSAHLYSHTLQKEIRNQLRGTAAGLISLLELIPRDEEAVRGLEGEREEILACTGHIWERCERMKAIAEMGTAGLAVEKVDEWHTLVKDAVEEIEGWDPDEEEGSLFGSDSSHSAKVAKSTVSGITTNGDANGDGLGTEPPALDTLQIRDIHAVKASTLKELRFLRLLYPALRKRRVSTFPQFDRLSNVESLPQDRKVEVLDRVLGFLKNASEETDEVAGALYDGDAGTVDRRLMELKTKAVRCLEEVERDWDGREDEFSAWSRRWVTKVEGGGTAS
ncbi:MAG: hypothetical protein Q9184_006518 [Pyrenodesmia sp. 2 TL-2023]